MNIRINDVEKTFTRQLTVAEMLVELAETSQRGLAVAVNGQVVPHKDWSTRKLVDQDKILLITATQGG